MQLIVSFSLSFPFAAVAAATYCLCLSALSFLASLLVDLL